MPEATAHSDAADASRAIRRSGIAAALFGAVGTVIILIRAGGPDNESLELGSLLLWAWVLAPFILLLAAQARSKRWCRSTQWVVLSFTLVVVAGSLFIYSQSVFHPRGSTDALVFLFIPLWSLLLILVGIPLLAPLVACAYRLRPGA